MHRSIVLNSRLSPCRRQYKQVEKKECTTCLSEQSSWEELCRFRLWAPGVDEVGLELQGQSAPPLRRSSGGWHELVTPLAEAGTRRKTASCFPMAHLFPDPASRYQPEDGARPK